MYLLAGFWVVIVVVAYFQIASQPTLDQAAYAAKFRRQHEADLNQVFDSPEVLERVRELMILRSSGTRSDQSDRLRDFLNDDDSNLWP